MITKISIILRKFLKFYENFYETEETHAMHPALVNSSAECYDGDRVAFYE